MKSTARWLSGAFFMALLLTQFNNCGNYADPAQNTDTSSLACTTANCITPSPDSMAIVPHLGNGQFAVPLGLQEFNL